MGAERSPEEIRESGVLDAFAKLEGVEVPKSELHRTVEHDSILVQQGLSKLKPEEIDKMKKSALKHPEVERDLEKAMKAKHYGSARHRQYAELIQELTGGVLSIEEAMAMNPSGGIPGAGMKELPILGSLDPVARHAMRHDATGFLLTRFGVGPGYGSKTTAFGLSKDNPMAGQMLGMLRETLNPSSLAGGDAAYDGTPLLGLGAGQKVKDGATSAASTVAGGGKSAAATIAGGGKAAASAVGGGGKSALSALGSGANKAKKKLGKLFG
jgi:hypothetical protein